MSTTVVNKYAVTHDYPEWSRDSNFVYIGRRNNGTHFGNPFSVHATSLAEIRVDSREDSIEFFKHWLEGKAYQGVEPERRRWILDNLETLKGKTLVCFCHPKPCHGDIYRMVLDGV